jgi:hypothetical protein
MLAIWTAAHSGELLRAFHFAIFAIGPFTFWPGSKLLLNQAGSKLRLTEKETSILRYL